MNRINFIIKYFNLVLIPLILICGCMGLVETTGQFLDGSVFEEKTISHYRSYSNYGAPFDLIIKIVENKKEERSLLITIEQFPMVKLRGTLPENDGTFFFTSLEYLAGNTHGFNEFSSELYGSGRLVLREISTFEITELPFQVQITDARIHRYDTRITGNDAVIAMRNRHERITALTEWMLETSLRETFLAMTEYKEQSIKDFEKFWKPVLFPEMVKRKHKPEQWRQYGDIFFRSMDINWNTSYTERLFPAHNFQHLVPVRNSGTLLRDFEEALSLIYLEYNWNNIIDILSKRLILYKIK